MGNSVPIRVSKELRKALGEMKSHPNESYDMLLRRKLSRKRDLLKKVKSVNRTEKKVNDLLGDIF